MKSRATGAGEAPRPPPFAADLPGLRRRGMDGRLLGERRDPGLVGKSRGMGDQMAVEANAHIGEVMEEVAGHLNDGWVDANVAPGRDPLEEARAAG